MPDVKKLGLKIKSYIHKSNLHVRDIERMAGLKRAAVSNIIDGKIKKPSLDNLRAIAKVLNCPLSEFLEMDELEPAIRLNRSLDSPQGIMSMPVTLPLLYETMDAVAICFKKIHYNPPLDLFLQCVKKVYIYALGNGENKIDPKFAEWVVNNLNNRDV